MSTLCVVVIVMGGFVLCGLAIDVVVVAGIRFLGSSRVGGCGKVECCGVLLWGCVDGEEGDCLISILACLL